MPDKMADTALELLRAHTTGLQRALESPSVDWKIIRRHASGVRLAVARHEMAEAERDFAKRSVIQ